MVGRRSCKSCRSKRVCVKVRGRGHMPVAHIRAIVHETDHIDLTHADSHRMLLPIIDLDVYRSQPLDSPAVVDECNKVFTLRMYHSKL